MSITPAKPHLLRQLVKVMRLIDSLGFLVKEGVSTFVASLALDAALSPRSGFERSIGVQFVAPDERQPNAQKQKGQFARTGLSA